MKAIVFTKPGGPDVLQQMELDQPYPKQEEVRVKIKAAGVQPVDCAIREGFCPPGVRIQYPQIIGNEFAGVVDQVGEGVTHVEVGDQVIGWSLLSCYAEYVVVPSTQIVPKPSVMPWEEAGVLTASGQTAHTALREIGITRGDTVIIHAAAGGVGSFAVQLAKAWRATVIGTASEQNHDYLRSMGAIPVTYGEGLVERVRQLAPQGVDAALDAVNEDALKASIELVANPKRIGTIVSFELAPKLGVLSIRSKRSTTRLKELIHFYNNGQLKITVSKSFPLQQAADAHRLIEQGHTRGKIVLMMDENVGGVS